MKESNNKPLVDDDWRLSVAMT